MPNKLSREEIIQRGTNKFGSAIIYPNFIYHGYDKKSIFTCVKEEHGDFESSPHCLLITKYGCPKCSSENSRLIHNIDLLTERKEIFLKRLNSKFGDKIKTSKFIFEGMGFKGIFTCINPEHGDFETTPNILIRSTHGCPKCAIEYTCNKSKLTKEELINKSQEKFGDKITFEKTIFVDMYTKTIFTCIKHKDFETTPTNLMQSKYGCQQCGNDAMGATQDEVLIQFNQKYPCGRYDYSEFIYYGNKIKSIIICRKKFKNGEEHGKFLRRPFDHLYGVGCPKCRTSQGERIIENIAVASGVKIITQFKFSDCKDKNPLAFDGYFPEYDACVEFDGCHHFSPEFLDSIGYKYPSYHTQAKYEDTKFKDTKKTDFCLTTNRPLLRIPFYDVDAKIFLKEADIEQRLKDFINSLQKIS